MFKNREDAAHQLAVLLLERDLVDPLILAIPRGGVVTGAMIARELGAGLDVVLSRKLRAQGHPEFAIGAISEDGRIYLNPDLPDSMEKHPDYLKEEGHYQLAEIARRRRLYRGSLPPEPIANRSIIVTDDGIATGSTMIAALQTIRMQKPREIIIAVPVAPPHRLAMVRQWCDDAVCLIVTDQFIAVGQFYHDFSQVDDAKVVALLRQFPHSVRDSEATQKGGSSTRVVAGNESEVP